jgi:hypothetical protein
VSVIFKTHFTVPVISIKYSTVGVISLFLHLSFNHCPGSHCPLLYYFNYLLSSSSISLSIASSASSVSTSIVSKSEVNSDSSELLSSSQLPRSIFSSLSPTSYSLAQAYPCNPSYYNHVLSSLRTEFGFLSRPLFGSV